MKKMITWKNEADKKKYLMTLMSDAKKVARTYATNLNYDVGEYITHSSFGFGFILKIISHTKVEIFFEDTKKIMLQNWSKT